MALERVNKGTRGRRRKTFLTIWISTRKKRTAEGDPKTVAQ